MRGAPKKPKVIAVIGPTASGKSSLGELICQKFEGEIISADSRQVYRGLDLGTGKEKLSIPQHLIDIADPGERMTVVGWKKRADKTIAEMVADHKLPVVVGGSSLYATALIDNFQFAPEDKTGHLRAELESLSTKKLQAKLKNLDPTNSTTVNTPNRRHLVRAVERLLLTPGNQDINVKPKYQTLLIARSWPREILYARIDERVDERLKEGMLEEVEGLIKKGIDKNWLRSLGLEYRYLTDYLDGRYSSLEEATDKLKTATHRFARQQLVWWRKRKEIRWVSTPKEAIELVKTFLLNR